jgi:hypothetical protein
MQMKWMHMSAEPSPLHDRTQGIMYNVPSYALVEFAY